MTVSMEKRIPKKRRASSTSAAGADPENLRTQGLRTRNTLIRVARKLLLDGGSLEFSLRAVAQGAGVSISNLQYYFPNRLALVRAVIEPVVETYMSGFKQAINSSTPPGEVLSDFLTQALHDDKRAKDTALWWHFVSIASTDPECSRLLDEWFDTLTDLVAQLVCAVNPQLDAEHRQQTAAVLVALAEGAGLLLGAGRNARADIRGLEAKFKYVAESLILEQPLQGK